MKVVIVADIDIADDVNTCVLGYSSKDGWEEIEAVPRPLPQREKANEGSYGWIGMVDNAWTQGFNDCLAEITGDME